MGQGPAIELGQLPDERVLGSKPEWLLRSRWRNYSPPKGTDLPPAIANLNAVREGRVIVLDGKFLTSVSQYAAVGVELLARKLHPGLFR